MKRSRLALLSWLVLSAAGAMLWRDHASAQAGPAPYLIIDLGTLGGSSSTAAAINASGQVTGTASIAGDAAAHAFLFSNNRMIDLGTLGGLNSAGYAINAAGHVKGNAETAAGAQHAFVYGAGGRVRDLGTLGGTQSAGFENTLNDSGQGTGAASTAGDASFHAFRSSAGPLADLGTLGGRFSEGAAINASGQIAGVAATANGESHAFLYANRTMADLGTLGGTFSAAVAINAAGQVAGTSTLAGDIIVRPFLYSGGTMTDLGTLGGDLSIAVALNDAGQVAGYSMTDGNITHHAFLYSGGAMVSLGTLGGSNSAARAIGPSGQVVGWAQVDGDAMHGFLYRDGVMVDLNSLIPDDAGWELVEGTAINARGQIVGHGLVKGQTHAFLMTPVREEAFKFTGFFAPVLNGALTRVKAGSVVPVRFAVGGNQGPGVIAPGYPRSVEVDCATTDVIGIQGSAATASSSPFTFDPKSARYTYTWKTEAGWTGCRQFILQLTDGNKQTAVFSFSK